MAHAFEIVMAPEQASNPPSVPKPEPPALPNVVPDRVQSHVLDVFSEVLADEASPLSVSPTGDAVPSPEHILGRRRFADDEDPTSIAEALRDGVAIDADWFEIRYHKCTHDAADAAEQSCPADWSVATDSNGDPIRGGDVPDFV